MTKTQNQNKFQITERSVEGAKYVEERVTDQLSAAEFIALIDEILAVPGIKKIKWTQYTPYFNDGDPCEFSVNEPSLKVSKRFGFSEEDGDEEDGFVDDYALRGETIDDSPFPRTVQYGTPEYQEAYAKWIEKRYSNTANGQDTSEILRALTKFVRNIPAMEAVAKANFGDHAVVTATTKGFEVESYEHD